MSKNGKVYRSPLFYVGDKYKLYPEISKYFPTSINRFIEPFTGGGSVFLNVRAKEYLLNDIDENVIKIHKYLTRQAQNPALFYDRVFQEITKYNLSHSYIKDVVPQTLKNEWQKTYYAKFNKIGFNELKQNFNKSQQKDILELYLLLIYGFNRMLRFNAKGEYNLPVGNVDFNKNVAVALNDYFLLTKRKRITFSNLDFADFLDNIKFNDDDFLYLDPPYLITFSEYNKLWNTKTEQRLIDYLDVLNDKGLNFAISNVTHYKDKINELFLKWSEQYFIKNIKSNYISYHDNTIKSFSEVLVTNYNPATYSSELQFENNTKITR